QGHLDPADEPWRRRTPTVWTATEPGRWPVLGKLDDRLVAEGAGSASRIPTIGREGVRAVLAQGEQVLHPVDVRPGQVQAPRLVAAREVGRQRLVELVPEPDGPQPRLRVG